MKCRKLWRGDAWAGAVALVLVLACDSPQAITPGPTASVKRETKSSSAAVAVGTLATVSALATRISAPRTVNDAVANRTQAPLQDPVPTTRPTEGSATQTPLATATMSLPTWSEVAATPTLGAPVPRAGAIHPIIETQFKSPESGWPDDPSGTAWFASDGYHLFARSPGEFVAIGAPALSALTDTVVTASFHKLAGPPGGGYGLIARDVDSIKRDGRNQTGRFYVAEVDDVGEIGIWRRETDHWVDLQPWTPSSAVYTGGTTNTVQLWTTGVTLVFIVNGSVVAAVQDDELAEGGVGLFVGGDFNHAVALNYTVQAVDPQ
jgi:hypothetical protein